MEDYITGVCPVCGGSLYTEDAILVLCDSCDFVSSSLELLNEKPEDK